MAAYAQVSDVQARLTRQLSAEEERVCATLLKDAALLIDAQRAGADPEAKKAVSCRMVCRALGNGTGGGIPLGATQGTVSALGYAESWTIGNGGSTGELYLSKTDKTMLDASNSIGSYSPVEELARGGESCGEYPLNW